jgi:outer membrane protein assembly factor BamB
MPSSRRRRTYLIVAVLAFGVLVGGSLAVYFLVVRPPGDVSNLDVAFEDRDPAEDARPKGRDRRVLWPTYGYTEARTRYLPTKLGPPFRRVWSRGGSKLLEFQPVLAKQTLFLVTNTGEALALSARTGTLRWRKRVGRLSASSPAWSRGRLFVTTLSRRVTSLDAKNGRVLWSRDLPSRSESSPLARRGRLYFGTEDGTVYCLRARDGRTVWKHRARGPVKAALAYSGGRLFFGDYAGEVSALRASDGRLAWRTGTSGRALRRPGRFYSTPAVAFGRVYLGNTDGRVYSFSARSGQVAWTRTTGDYVYAAPAVARVPGTPPSVYIGSYDGRFYALDARSGRIVWTYQAGGRISGAATVIGRVVYFSNLARKSTTGLDVRSGRPVFRFGRGAFNPVISDGKRLYLTGYSTQYAFEPVRPPGSATRPSARGGKPRPSGSRARSGRAPRRAASR